MMKNKRFLSLVSLMLALVTVAMLFVSCGAAEMDAVYPSANGGALKGDYGYDEVWEETATPSEEKPVMDESTMPERKIIKTYRVRMETLRYDAAVELITDAVSEFGGYMSNASQEGTGVNSARTRSASFTVRIPADRAEAYIERISGECNVLSSSLTTEDVTDTYYGYEARMESLLLQEERLLAMMEKADKLSDLITLEDKLSSVRAEINGLNKQLQLMDKSVQYSYIYVTLNEVKEYKEPEKVTYFDRLFESLGGTFKSFASVLGEILIVLIWVLPYGAVAAVVVVVIVACSKRNKKKKNENREDPQ